MGDEFVEGSFRVILRGTTLAVKIEGCPATFEVVNPAERLAKSYIDNLGRNLGEQLQLLTEEEFRSLPPWASQNQAVVDFALRQRSSYVARNPRQALRDARHSVTSYTWPLKDCYDYMPDATASDESFCLESYKMIETMANHYDPDWPLRKKKNGPDWEPLRKKTGLAAEINFLKKVANEGHSDARHPPPKDQTPWQPLTGAERVKARDCASRILRKFEELCRSERLAG